MPPFIWWDELGIWCYSLASYQIGLGNETLSQDIADPVKLEIKTSLGMLLNGRVLAYHAMDLGSILVWSCPTQFCLKCTVLNSPQLLSSFKFHFVSSATVLDTEARSSLLFPSFAYVAMHKLYLYISHNKGQTAEINNNKLFECINSLLLEYST